MDVNFLLEVLNKVAITVSATIITTLAGIVLGKLLSKMNSSRIYKYAKTLVEAAEQKYPNEGIKMGPQKEAYVMSQLSVKFPKIRDNRYLYNIVLQCVYELNQTIHKEAEQSIQEKANSVEIENNDISNTETNSNTDMNIVDTPTNTVISTTQSVQVKSKKHPSSF